MSHGHDPLASRLNNRHKVWALIPVKDFRLAKSRLRGVLQADECSALASNMARDVVAALAESASVHGVTLLGGAPEIEGLARELGCAYLEEYDDAGLSANLNMAARQLSAEDVDTLVVIPSDLPLLRPQDIDALLARIETGLCVCAANRDGGTNALVISPPDAIQFHYGMHSAQRHVEAGQAAGLLSKKIDEPAFAVDIDTPDDLIWLCQQAVASHTADFLDHTGLRTKILQAAEVLTA